MRWLLWFVGGSVGAVAAVLFGLWAYAGFADPGLPLEGLIALVLGILGTTGMAVGLMALVFHSHRSHADEEVHRGDHTD